MSEPYVPIAQLAVASNLLAELEVTTDAAETNADALELATNNALGHKQTVDNLVASKFVPFFLVGA